MTAAATLVGVSFTDAGYFAASRNWTTLALAWMAGLALVLRRRAPVDRFPAFSLLAFGAFVGWIALSTLWAPSAADTVPEVQRGLLYLAALLALLIGVPRAAAPALMKGLVAGVVLVSMYALATRLFPDRVGAQDSVAGNRLSEPLGYPNALGIFAVMGALGALGIALRDRRALDRALAGAGLVISGTTAYFCFSRGAFIALLIALLVLIALERARLFAITGVVLIGGWAMLAAGVATRFDALSEQQPAFPDAVREGHRFATVLALTAAGAALTAAAWGMVGRRVSVPNTVRRAYAIGLAGLAMVAIVLAFAYFGTPASIARDAWGSFKSTGPAKTTRLSEPTNRSRPLLTLSGNRYQYWRVAWDDYRDHPLLGSGAGSYAAYWFEHRTITESVKYAHNLYAEMLAELGPAGVALLIAALAIPFAAATRAREAAAVPAAAAAFGAFVVHAGVDWDWEMPAVTLPALGFAAVQVLSVPARRTETISGRLRTALAALALMIAGFALVGVIGASAVSESRESADRGDWAKAEREARKAIRWSPWAAEPWQRLGHAQLGSRHDRQAARRSFRKAIAKDPQDWTLWFDLAIVSDGRAHRGALTEARRLNPLSSALASYRRPRSPRFGPR